MLKERFKSNIALVIVMSKRGLFVFLILAVFLGSLNLASASHQCILKENCGGYQAGHVRSCGRIGEISECTPKYEVMPDGSSEPGAEFSAQNFLEKELGSIRAENFDSSITANFLKRCVDTCYENNPGGAEECDATCQYRNRMANSLPDLILCEYALKNAKDHTIENILIEGANLDYYNVFWFRAELEDDLRNMRENNARGEDNAVPEGHAYRIVSDSYNKYLSEIPQDIARPAEFPSDKFPYYPFSLVAGKRKEICDKELNKLSEEELASAENEPIDNSKTDSDDTELTPYITDYQGKVLIKDPNGNAKPLTGKVPIGEGITLATGKTGKVLVKFRDESKIEIGPNSQVTVGNSKTESKLDFGRLKFKINCFINTINCYPFRTTNSVASVRGTEYIAISDQYSNTTTILVNDGTVSITETKTGLMQNVSGGNFGVVDTSGINVNPMPETEWENASGEFDLEKNSNPWTLYVGLGVLLAIGLIIYKKMKKDSKTIKNLSIEHKKSEKTMGETKKWGIASLILAILSLLLLLLPFIGIILAILAVVFARIQKKHIPTGIATAGFVIGIIGIVFNAIMFLAVSAPQ